MSTDHQCRTVSSSGTFENYRGNPAELYQRHFVPAIGLPFATAVIDAATLRPGERVLDVACGTGVATRLAAERVGASGTVAGIDGEAAMVDVARRAGSEGVAIDWREASAEGLPFADSSFDVALSSLGLEFFADKVRALTEMKRLVSTGGRVSVGVPGQIPALFEVLHDVLAEYLGADTAAFVRAVFSLDDPERLRALMAAAGLVDIEVDQSPISLRLDGPADFFWQYLLGTPLAFAVAGVDQRTRDAMEADIVARWQPFVSGANLVVEVPSIVGVATCS